MNFKANKKLQKSINDKNIRRYKIGKRLLELGLLNENELLKKFKTTSNGLTEIQANERIDKYGLNEINYGNKETWIKRLIKAFINPFSVVLIILELVSFFTDYIMAKPGERSLQTVIIIGTMVTLSGGLRFIQEGKSNKAGEKLKAMIKTKANVKRNGKSLEIPIEDLVIGDIVHLAAGDMVPADMRLLFSKDLFISQSSMTGESEPVEKIEKNYKSNEDNISSHLELENLVYMGTTVISGTAIGVVISTGNDTCIGTMADAITEKREDTSFDKGVNAVSWVLIRFMACMVPVVFVINGLTKGSWLESFLFALSVAVGLTPEMLPMIVTTNLAKGAVTMSKRKTIVKNLNSIQNFGAMDILCTDKTGTLTEDRIILERHLDIHGNEDSRVLKHAYLNSYFQTGLKNLLDIAILNHGDEEGFSNLEKDYIKIDEIPFDFTRRRMSVVLKDKKGKTQLITKGAVEEMLSICTLADDNGKAVKLTDKVKDEVLRVVDELNDTGMRVVAVAQKNNPLPEHMFSVKDEENMVLMGYIGFLDPPKESSEEAIKALHEYGVKVKVLTGDNEKVTEYVCRKVGIDANSILLGLEIENMNSENLKKAVENINIFAKLSPQQKSQVVSALKDNGHVVGFMGDGINDAPAMRKSDVGISVDTAVDIAKESADIILLEKNLMVLEKGVIEGRRTFANIIKYIKMTASSNFGNMFSVLVACAFLPFLPMLPIQILVLNLIYDLSCTSIPWDNVDPEYLKEPRKWDASSIGSFMKWIGPTSSVFDIMTYIILFFIICPMICGGHYGEPGVNTALFVALFNAGWFVESLWSQTLVIHMIRTPKIPFIQSRAALPVIALTSVAILVGTAIPYTFFGKYMKMSPMPPIYFLWLFIIVMLYMILVTIIKKIYIKKYGKLL